MKGQLENSIKDSLAGFEAPYNPAAWDAMRAKLDAKMPVSPPKSGGSAKWFVAAAIVAGVGVGAYFLFSTPEVSDEPAQNETTVTDSDSQSNETGNTTVNTVDNSTTGAGNTPVSSNLIPNTSANPSQTGTSPASQSPNFIDLFINNPSGPGVENPDQRNPVDNQVRENASNQKNQELSIPRIATQCQNDVINVDNTNETALVLTGPDTYFAIPANESRKIRLKKAGNYKISGKEDNYADQFTEFRVNEAPSVDFTVDPSTKFENGLPVTKIETSVHGADFEWVYGGDRASGSELNAHFYSKGNHEVTLVVTGSNGCQSSLSKNIFIEENYNLMAPTSFRPNSNDPSVNTFMPYALKERNVNFTLIVIDPRDGHVLFETKDASQGWDGVDRKTGGMVDFENAYIWKVTLGKKASGEERNEYSGQVIPVQSSK